MVPREDGRHAPIVLPAVVFGLELGPVGVVHREEDGLLLSGVNASLTRLMVDSRAVDRSSVLGGSLVLVLMLNHVVFHGSCDLNWHLCILTILAQKQLAKANSCRDLPFKPKLD